MSEFFMNKKYSLVRPELFFSIWLGNFTPMDAK